MMQVKMYIRYMRSADVVLRTIGQTHIAVWIRRSSTVVPLTATQAAVLKCFDRPKSLAELLIERTVAPLDPKAVSDFLDAAHRAGLIHPAATV